MEFFLSLGKLRFQEELQKPLKWRSSESIALDNFSFPSLLRGLLFPTLDPFCGGVWVLVQRWVDIFSFEREPGRMYGIGKDERKIPGKAGDIIFKLELLLSRGTFLFPPPQPHNRAIDNARLSLTSSFLVFFPSVQHICGWYVMC